MNTNLLFLIFIYALSRGIVWRDNSLILSTGTQDIDYGQVFLFLYTFLYYTVNRQRRFAKLSTEQNLFQADFGHTLSALTQLIVSHVSNRDHLWLQHDVRMTPSRTSDPWYFQRESLSLDPPIVCPKSLNRLDPFLRDLAKSGEITNDHKSWHQPKPLELSEFVL